MSGKLKTLKRNYFSKTGQKNGNVEREEKPQKKQHKLRRIYFADDQKVLHLNVFEMKGYSLVEMYNSFAYKPYFSI